MSIDDRVPDHAELRRLAAQRARRGRWLGFGIALAAFVLPTAALLTVDEPGPPAAALFVPALIGILALVVTFTVVGRREREPDLAAGADRLTRRAVQQALRTGDPADARIDALTREVAAGTVRRRWLVWLYVPLVLLQFVALVSRVAAGDGGGSIALSAALTATFALLLAVQVSTWRRSRRYLARPPYGDGAGGAEGRAS